MRTYKHAYIQICIHTNINVNHTRVGQAAAPIAAAPGVAQAAPAVQGGLGGQQDVTTELLGKVLQQMQVLNPTAACRCIIYT